VDGDSHSLMVVMYPADEFRQVGLYFSQRQRCHGQKFDQNVGGSQTADWTVPARRLTAGSTWHGKGTRRARRRQSASLSAILRTAGTRPDLAFWVGAGEGNRTLMTSLEGCAYHLAVQATPRSASLSSVRE
jgi:hypothetical protein